MLHDMQNELKQTKPFEVAEEELFLSLIHTADMLGRKVSDFLKEHNLSTAQYNVLRILRGAQPEGLPCGEISLRMVTRDPDVTRLLDRLEVRSLVSRARDAGDRRVVSTRITPEGLALLGSLDADVLNIHKKQFGFLNAEETRQILQQLTRVREHLE